MNQYQSYIFRCKMRMKTCRRCGYCCSYMGDVFGIVEKTGPSEYRVQYLITGVEQIVRIDPDKEEIFTNSTILDKHPLACPFLRDTGEGRYACTVHQTRPELCRMYICPDRSSDLQKSQSDI